MTASNSAPEWHLELRGLAGELRLTGDWVAFNCAYSTPSGSIICALARCGPRSEIMMRLSADDAANAAVLDTSEWFRQEAEKCFRLPERTTDESAADALLTYGSELLARAERMEATLLSVQRQ
jgi:hypothetical protein